MSSEASGESVQVHFALRVGDVSLEADVEVPAGPVATAALLPVIQPVADAVVDASVRRVREAGLEISCKAGCGACCRQPVPVAFSEARMLVALVEAMPAARRGAVEQRFDAALTKLEDHDLLGRLQSLDHIEDADQRQELALEYFRLGIPCPFLEEESCSIHADRPLACREYLVTSPASRCAAPTAENIELVPVPVRPSVTLFRFDELGEEGPPQALPMIFAREWVEQHSEVGEAELPGPQLFERYVRRLAGKSGESPL
jgi:Fe-S-cluster containining protein